MLTERRIGIEPFGKSDSIPHSTT